MGLFKEKEDYDYTIDDGIEVDNEEYEDEDEEDNSFSVVLKRWYSNVKEWIKERRERRDEEDEEEDEEEPPKRTSKQQSRNNEENTRRTAREERRQQTGSGVRRRSYEAEPSEEDLDNYDKKYGTFGSGLKERQKRENRARFNINAGKESNKVTKVAEWGKYKGNVKNILEVEPKNMDEVGEIARCLQDEYAAIISLRSMRDQRQKVIDFLDGVAFILDYRFENIGDNYYICAPNGYMRRYELGKKYGKNG